MPVPTPHDGESQDDFIARCMANDDMQEYEDKQRAAICYDAWNGGKSLNGAPRLLSVDEFRARHRLGIDGLPGVKDAGIFRVSIGKPKAHDEARRSYRFCFSDSGEDRMKDTIDAKGWRLGNFLRAPTALFAHDSMSPPIGKATNVLVEGERLMGDIEFAPPEIYAFADTIYKLVGGGYLNAVSVGFMPIDYKWSDDEDREWGIDFQAQELLEISVVPVPANPRALIEARAKGIDTRPLVEWAEKTLDGGGKVIVPRAELERLRKAAKEPRMPGEKRIKADGMNESDPADGGATVGNCGRPLDQECGMKNPAECSIHGFGGAGAGSPDEDKRMNAQLRKILREELLRTMKSLRRAEGEEEPGDVDAPPEPITEAYAHMKAAHLYHKMAMASHKKAMSLVGKAVEGDDGNDEPDGREDTPDGEGGEDKALIAEIERLRAA